MFQSVKQKICTFLNPLSDTDNNLTGTGTKRKRRRIEEDDDCQIIYPEKRQRQGNTLRQWNLKSIFDFMRGTISTNPVLIRNSSMYTGQDAEKSKPKHTERSFLSPARRFQPVKRTSLRQISNSTILDLTHLDNEEKNKDLELTKVSYDLSQEQQEKSIVVDDNDISFNTSTLSSKSTSRTYKSPKAKPRSVFLTEGFRLKEKECYKQLLAKFTDVRLPEYSESISPKKPSSYTPSSIDLTDTTITENIDTSPLFYRKSFQKSFSIDLTREETRSFSKESNKKYVDLTYVEPEVEILHDTTSSILKSKQKCKEVSAVLDLGWIRKWKETLDPIQLERERRISEEERKCEAIKRKQLEQIEKLSKQGDEFPELSTEILNKVKQSLAPGNSKEVFVEGFNAEITRGDIATLRKATWLNDEVVNFYFNLIKSRSEGDANLPKVHVFNTFFYPKIMKTGHAGVKRWTRKVDIFSVDVILIPVHLGMHWCLAVIDVKNKEIVYYDSLKGNNTSCIQALKKYLNDESQDKKKTSFDFTGWKELMPKDIPEQMNGCDCGVFMCKYAEYKSRYAKFTFTQDNMPYFRKRMIHEILSKKLM